LRFAHRLGTCSVARLVSAGNADYMARLKLREMLMPEVRARGGKTGRGALVARPAGKLRQGRGGRGAALGVVAG
jgi:hypothetical protein